MSIWKYVSAFVLLISAEIFPAGRYYEWVIPLVSIREYRVQKNRVKNSLTIQLKNTKPVEISTTIPHNPKIIKGIFVTELPAYGTEITLRLADANLQAHVVRLDDPPRFSIQIFELGYQLDREPTSLLPRSSMGKRLGKSTNEDAPLSYPHLLLEPTAPPVFSAEPLEVEPSTYEEETENPQAWQAFPPYVYPLPLSLFLPANESQASEETEEKTPSEIALDAYQAGFHKKALRLYQQILQEKEELFEKEPLPLWILAELTFEQKNFLLAHSYYTMVVERFVGSNWARYAALRKVDIQALSNPHEKKELDQTLSLDSISASGDAEFLLQKLIRNAYWHSPSVSNSLPVFSAEEALQASDLLEKAQIPKTKYLASNLLLHTYIQPEKEWDSATTAFASRYFDSNENEEENSFYTVLQKKCIEKIHAKILTQFEKKKTKEIVELFDSIPAALKKKLMRKEVQWALAESYRSESQAEKALSFYRSLPVDQTNVPRAFITHFWLATLGAQFLHTQKIDKEASKEKIKKADLAMKTLWKDMTEADKVIIRKEIKGEFENSLLADSHHDLETPSEIVLETWQKVLTKNKETKPDWTISYPVTEKTVFLLDRLAAFFEKKGKEEQAAAAILLFKEIPTEKVNESKEGKKIWATRLLDLADKYRLDNQFYDAGDIHVYLATHLKDWDQRAESFYKGGLLLYRAGKREMAIQAFRSARDDVNNPFYANLAKEHLVQLSK